MTRPVWRGRLGRCASVLALATLAPLVGYRVGWVPAFALVAVVLGVRLAAAVLARRLVAVTVRGRSMQPTFRDGDRVLVRRTSVPAVGEVVVVEDLPPGGWWALPPVSGAVDSAELAGRRWVIKRVAAVPGDAVPPVPALRAAPGARVPPGRLVLLGDNRSASYDSRQLGYFPVERMLGRVCRALPRRRSRRPTSAADRPVAG